MKRQLAVLMAILLICSFILPVAAEREQRSEDIVILYTNVQGIVLHVHKMPGVLKFITDNGAVTVFCREKAYICGICVDIDCAECFAECVCTGFKF